MEDLELLQKGGGEQDQADSEADKGISIKDTDNTHNFNTCN